MIKYDTRIKIFNIPRSIRKTEFNNHLPTKSPRPKYFTGKLHQTFKEGITQSLHKHFQKREKEEWLPHSFCKASITDTQPVKK